MENNLNAPIPGGEERGPGGKDDRSALGLKERLRRLPGTTLAGFLISQFSVRLGYRLHPLSPAPGSAPTLQLETSSRCNLRCEKCALCANSQGQGLMDPGLAFDLIDQAANMGVPEVCLSRYGEPLLHPELEAMIRRAKERGLLTYFVTNAVLLTPERSRSMIAAGLDSITVSLDGWDEASYARRQGGANLARTLDNLRQFRELRGQLTRPSLVFLTVLDSESAAHLGPLKKVLSPYADEIKLVPLLDYGDPAHPIPRNLLLGTSSWRRRPCLNLWKVLSVGWEGAVSACCNDYNYLLKYHHASQAPLAEIWRDQTLQEWRRRHLRGEFDRVPMCGQCTGDYANSLHFYRIKRNFNLLRP